MRIAICIDFDNLLDIHKQQGILDVVTNSLMKLPLAAVGERGVCDIRLYGGWYEGNVMTSLSQRISASIQNEFPAVIRIPSLAGNPSVLTATAELAMSLLEEPAHHLFNTYRKKGKPSNVRVSKPENVGCCEADCPLLLARKLLATGNCPNANCSITGDLVYRHEQKIVDTMLTCDFIHLAQQPYDYLLVISNDDDFLPPIRTALLRGKRVVRVHPRMSAHLPPINVAGSGLIEVGL